MKMLTILLLASFMFVCSAWPQAAPETPKPNPELQKEGDYFVGTWKFTGETKPSPLGPGGKKFESSERLEWLPGGFFLVARSYQGEQWRQLTVIGYDEKKKVFTHTSYNAHGHIESMEGTVRGDTETWSTEAKSGGKLVKQQFIVKKLSPTLYTFKFEVMPEGGPWSVVYEGQAVKTQ